MGIDLVVNPHARMYQRDPSLLSRVQRAADDRCTVHVTETIDELRNICTEIAERGSELVLLSGGDGSLMAGVSALSEAFDSQLLPPIAPIPGGTAGTVARNWGLHGDPVRCLERLLTGPRRHVRRPSLQVKTTSSSGHQQTRVGFIVGTGLVAKFFELYYERGAPGYLGSAQLVARIFVESFVGGPVAGRVLEPLPCRLEVDGELRDPSAWSLICSAVIQNLGIHMLVTHRGGEDPSRPHLVATPMAPRQLGPRVHRVLAGQPIGGPHHVDQLVQAFTVHFEDSGPFVLDGELLEARTIAVDAGPTLTIATPL